MLKKIRDGNGNILVKREEIRGDRKHTLKEYWRIKGKSKKTWIYLKVEKIRK